MKLWRPLLFYVVVFAPQASFGPAVALDCINDSIFSMSKRDYYWCMGNIDHKPKKWPADFQALLNCSKKFHNNPEPVKVEACRAVETQRLRRMGSDSSNR